MPSVLDEWSGSYSPMLLPAEKAHLLFPLCRLYMRCEVPPKGCQWLQMCRTLVTGYVGIDDLRPAIDTARERLGLLKTLFAEPHGHGERSGSMVAENDDRLVRIELLMSAGWNVSHGHQDRSGQVCSVKLPWLADV